VYEPSEPERVIPPRGVRAHAGVVEPVGVAGGDAVEERGVLAVGHLVGADAVLVADHADPGNVVAIQGIGRVAGVADGGPVDGDRLGDRRRGYEQ
jgi:hypothetical protein